ncbi:MAG TPA: tRNA (adenosine(37)-N6)-dimethylallyltransferase MiaA [Caulobacteraceae bacterium]|jgi:tRNA dimethylallyltransferase|nr:tRNA (adenosine(37)-N6)-dimethylallyltransferase MiaA [Caulobacteraceae bacterium]
MSRSPASPIWLVAGPTASGKSTAALALARGTGGEIVNADSMQLYADLGVLTARPSATDVAALPHHLFGIADAGEAWSVGSWLAAALEVLAAIAARGAPAIVVGGTGLYFRALTVGLAEIPPIPASVRAAAQGDYDRQGEAAFRARLAEVDPDAEARIAPADRQRLTRAMEVFEATGRPLSHWQAATRPALPADAWSGVVLAVPRADLHARIDARLEAMVAGGALAEVAALVERRLDPALPAMKALGVASFARHLAGEITLAEALAHAQAETRRYAKRQITWFGRQAADWPRLEADAVTRAFTA